jgi:hypothetical protein
MKPWRYLWRRWLGWFPFQTCYVCGRWYWGGLPLRGWRASNQDYCSRRCADIDMEELSIDDGFGCRTEEDDEYEGAVDNCGIIPGEGCTKAGSEECDFECPFRDELYGEDDESV